MNLLFAILFGISLLPLSYVIAKLAFVKNTTWATRFFLFLGLSLWLSNSGSFLLNLESSVGTPIDGGVLQNAVLVARLALVVSAFAYYAVFKKLNPHK